MAFLPVLSRLPIAEYVALSASLIFLFFESAVRFITILLPAPILNFFHDASAKYGYGINLILLSIFLFAGSYKLLFVSLISVHSMGLKTRDTIQTAAHIYRYEAEEHLLETGDGYLLCLHRISRKRNEKSHYNLQHGQPDSINKPVAYFHHGLMMNSEVWVCQVTEKNCLAFRMVEEGYDCWFGNNRGNKYSRKHVSYNAAQRRFWDYSMDQYAFYDIPDTIKYILSTTKQETLTYIGFSQGSAQAFAALSVHPSLNDKINLFIALAPAMSPHGLANSLMDTFMKASPAMLFLLFGRKAVLSSTAFWQSVLYPPIFVRIIDLSLRLLFNWRGDNISFQQKVVSYAHLYSYSSVKSVVHWFQIIRSKTFQLYDDDPVGPAFMRRNFYKVARFPTKNIKSPIILIYGERDSIVDIQAMKAELPAQTIIQMIPNYEHLDLLWGKDIEQLLFPWVFAYLAMFAKPVNTARQQRMKCLRKQDIVCDCYLTNGSYSVGIKDSVPSLSKSEDGAMAENGESGVKHSQNSYNSIRVRTGGLRMPKSNPTSSIARDWAGSEECNSKVLL